LGLPPEEFPVAVIGCGEEVILKDDHDEEPLQKKLKVSLPARELARQIP
jgi:hypothetical protein